LPRRKHNYTPEFREESVKLVIDTSRPIAQVAKELGVVEGTLGNWVNAYRRDHASDEAPLTMSERVRLREAERELRELKQKVVFLEKVAAYFASEPR
jgi:transposase-like protein